MTATTSYAFNPSITQMITQVYRDLNVINDEEQPTTAQYEQALSAANFLVKGLQATGIHVWTEEEAILFLQPLQQRYTVGSSGTNDRCVDAESWIQAQLNSSLSAGATVLPLVSASGISVADDIGVILDAGSTFWTTVSSISTNNVTIAAPLPSSASAQNYVLDYPPSAQITRPLKIPRGRTFTLSSTNENPMTVLSRQEYMDLPNKNAQGVPTQFFYSPKASLGYIYPWPIISTCAYAMRFTWYRSLADLLVPANTIDFPQEWLQPIRWLLADDLRIGHSIPPARQTEIKAKAAEWTEVITSWDRESEPVQFGMDQQYGTSR